MPWSVQAPSSVVMIRPHFFAPNPETALDNAFQQIPGCRDRDVMSASAHAEVTAMARLLEAQGVNVHLFENESRSNLDAVFPNNWFSTHAGGHVAIYPMYSPSRRAERRVDVIEMLKRCYRVQDIIDYSGLEEDDIFIEGTGGMVLDHIGRVAYAARSNRLSDVALERFCTHFNFEPMVFDTATPAGRPVYHTNVVMSIGTHFALVGMDLITDPVRQNTITKRLEETGRKVIKLDYHQVMAFAGNAIELQGSDHRFLAMSSRGLDSLRAEQRRAIEATVPIVAIDVPTIELAGGSVRCMVAGIHLSPRAEASENQRQDGALVVI
ncbi:MULTISPECIES: citrulline utilization hydrolase CtlX [unclassified Novosphingobium]|uniref:citrulline utilization hydrolase CtlX n=1 Tax=unclassified Novosphingobium TaxID=2644732 RepID=UPI00135991BD|nr:MULTISPECIES: arginine deiminase-related protein [unclassified Novosphingobium]